MFKIQLLEEIGNYSHQLYSKKRAREMVGRSYHRKKCHILNVMVLMKGSKMV